MPTVEGRYGKFGGRFVPELLMPALLELEKAYTEATQDERFTKELDYYLQQYVGRQTPLYEAENLSKQLGSARIFLKREDLNHTGAHKINNAIGQALLAKRMGNKKIIAETGAGQQGVATATVCALLDLKSIVSMDVACNSRQVHYVFLLDFHGAMLECVFCWKVMLNDSVKETLLSALFNVAATRKLIGSLVAPLSSSKIVRDCTFIIGTE